MGQPPVLGPASGTARLPPSAPGVLWLEKDIQGSSVVFSMHSRILGHDSLPEGAACGAGPLEGQGGSCGSPGEPVS